MDRPLPNPAEGCWWEGQSSALPLRQEAVEEGSVRLLSISQDKAPGPSQG